MLLPGTMSLSTSYAIFMGEIAGVHALERHDCGAFGSALINFQSNFFKVAKKNSGAIATTEKNAPPPPPKKKRRIRPHLAPEPRAFGACKPGTVIDGHLDPTIFFRATHEAPILISICFQATHEACS